MNIYQISTIGEFHTNHNEDYSISGEIGNDRLLIAVMDGCSMGTDSYLASTIIGKLLRKTAKALSYKTFINKEVLSLEQTIRAITQELFEMLKGIKNQLDLERDELLCTLILGVVDIKYRTAEILTVGDGLICCNGQLTEYEQDNTPDYLGYHLNKDFETWYAAQSQRLSLTEIQDLSISTDGIFTFRKFDHQVYDPISELEVIKFLLKDIAGSGNENMLKGKILDIENKWGLKPTDDLTIIRLMF